ncbi:unnamed protein product [Urochloa humidicola]
MAGSAPMGDGWPALGTEGDGSSRTRPPPRLAVAPLPRAISGDGRPPRPSATTSATKKRRNTFVAPTRPPAARPNGVLPRPDLNAGVDPSGTRPRQVPDAAPGTFLPHQLYQAPPPGPRLPGPQRHEAPESGSVFTGAGRMAQTPSFSEPAQLPSHQVLKTSLGAAATVSDRNAIILEVLTQAPIADNGSSRGRGGNYNHNEDIQLCWSWMAITFDPRIGNDQPKDTYWNRIAQHYHENKTFVSDRNATSLEKRWNGIQRECVRFQECIEKIERLRPSGVPRTEYINLAQKSYDEAKGFPYIHCWMEVRHTEKFQTVYEAMKQAQGKKQSKSMTPSQETQEAQEDDRAPSKRPPGRKQSKQKQKRNDGEDEYVVQFATLIQMKAEEHQKREERWKAEKELEERKLLWDQEQKIMFCNTSNMDESQRAYVKAMRQQIAAAKEALVKASGGGSTSEQGSGGYAEEAESLM